MQRQKEGPDIKGRTRHKREDSKTRKDQTKKKDGPPASDTVCNVQTPENVTSNLALEVGGQTLDTKCVLALDEREAFGAELVLWCACRRECMPSRVHVIPRVCRSARMPSRTRGAPLACYRARVPSRTHVVRGCWHPRCRMVGEQRSKHLGE